MACILKFIPIIYRLHIEYQGQCNMQIRKKNSYVSA